MSDRELERLWRKLQPLAVNKMPLAEPPPRNSRFGSTLVLSRMHWVRPEMVVEVSYLAWTEDGLLRQVVYLGEREDKPAARLALNSVCGPSDRHDCLTPRIALSAAQSRFYGEHKSSRRQP